MDLKRYLKHTLTPGWVFRRPFPAAIRERITAAIRESESRHRAQIVFVIEDALEPGELWCGMTPTTRARDVFAQARVWDTAENCGVLIYLLLADHAVEIVADRGVDARSGQAAWESICRQMEAAFRAGHFEEGALTGIRAVTDILVREYPAGDAPRANELPDQPTLLR